jgi:mannitol-1-phosphate 5-dehydrogenase
MTSKAVMYGAGNIGRGFIGKAFSESGYEVCFVDVVKEVVDTINRDKSYPVRIVSNEGHREETVRNIRAVLALDIESVSREIADADIMATAVGVNALPKIIKPICSGLRQRFAKSGRPLNIIICENLISADEYIRKMIEQEMGEEYKAVLDEKLGLIEASIGRMVPVMTGEMREGNILRVWVEPYDALPVDKDAFVGEIPVINNLIPYSPFGYIIKRKLFIHNMGHAMFAYLGWLKGYKYIFECVEDESIRGSVYAAMQETAAALRKEYGISKQELDLHIEDLLMRFENRALGDTVERVAKDPVRKLGINDRLIGAALYCRSMGIEPENVIEGIAAALRYNNPNDEAAVKMHIAIKEKGLSEYLESYCGIKDGQLLKMIVRSTA